MNVNHNTKCAWCPMKLTTKTYALAGLNDERRCCCSCCFYTGQICRSNGADIRARILLLSGSRIFRCAQSTRRTLHVALLINQWSRSVHGYEPHELCISTIFSHIPAVQDICHWLPRVKTIQYFLASTPLPDRISVHDQYTKYFWLCNTLSK